MSGFTTVIDGKVLDAARRGDDLGQIVALAAVRRPGCRQEGCRWVTRVDDEPVLRRSVRLTQSLGNLVCCDGSRG